MGGLVGAPRVESPCRDRTVEDPSSHSPSSSAFAMAGVTQEPPQRSWEPVHSPPRGNPLPEPLGAGTWEIISSHISSEDKDFESSIRKGKCRAWSKDPKQGGPTSAPSGPSQLGGPRHTLGSWPSPGRFWKGRRPWSPRGMEPTLPNFGNEGSVGSAGFFCEGPDTNYFGLRGPAFSVAAALPDPRKPPETASQQIKQLYLWTPKLEIHRILCVAKCYSFSVIFFPTT